MNPISSTYYPDGSCITCRVERVKAMNPVTYRKRRKPAFYRSRFFKVLLVLVVIAAAFIVLMSSINRTQAEESESAIKQYKSIIINPGDSLWSIASEYMDGHYSTKQEYINELMFINNLESDLILVEEYLLIPYYVG